MRIKKSSIIAIGIALSICIAGTGCQLQPGGKWYNPTAWKLKHKKDTYESSYASEEDNVITPRSGAAPEIHSPNGGYSNPTMVAGNPNATSYGGTGSSTYAGDRRAENRYDYNTNNNTGPLAPNPNVTVNYNQNQNTDPRNYQGTNPDPRTGQYAPNNQSQYQPQPVNNGTQRDQYYVENYGQYSGTGTNSTTNQQYYDQPAVNGGSSFNNGVNGGYNNNSYNNGGNNNSYNSPQSNGFGPGSTDPGYNYNYNDNTYR